MQYRRATDTDYDEEEEPSTTPSLLKALRPIDCSKRGAYREALVQAIEQLDDADPDKASTLVTIAGQLVVAAKKGSQEAARQIADRLDGRPAQAIDVVADISGTVKVDQLSDFEAVKRIAFIMTQGLALLPKQQEFVNTVEGDASNG